jgi:hypothetical protein
MQKKYCKVCQSEIPEKRVQLGYKDTCVNHSSAQRYSGVITSSGKSDYEIAVIKDPKQAEHIAKLSNIY